jgi:hypothetical protein
MVWIGIDPGTETGFAVWDDSKRTLIDCRTLKIHKAIDEVKIWSSISPGNVILVFEDARQRRWYGSNSWEKMQGAGSVKRDCSIWEDFCKDLGLPFQAQPPQGGMTKVSSEYFKMISHWTGRTSNHARDAAMLVIGR